MRGVPGIHPWVTIEINFSSINNNYDEMQAKYEEFWEVMIKVIQTFETTIRNVHNMKGFE